MSVCQSVLHLINAGLMTEAVYWEKLPSATQPKLHRVMACLVWRIQPDAFTELNCELNAWQLGELITVRETAKEQFYIVNNQKKHLCLMFKILLLLVATCSGPSAITGISL